MKASSITSLIIALIHYPVLNKKGDIITSAVTNLDLHDIARTAKTFGVPSYYVVSPLADQRGLIERIITHWVTGPGAQYNPQRREAMELIRIVDHMEEVIADILKSSGRNPKIVATSAKTGKKALAFTRFREMIRGSDPYILTFGTGWGISEDFVNSADYVLEPITGCSGYNHLSVRSAAAIILDRLLGRSTGADPLAC